MPDDLQVLTQRLSQAAGSRQAAAATTVAHLAHPVDVVDAELPVNRLELVLRSVHVASVAVRDAADPDRVGLITRPRFTAAMAGRLGFGRAVLARKVTGELTDWSPMIVDRTESVSQVAVRAMERADERRYDDVLVAGRQWRVASMADLVRSLSVQLAVRSLHDPVTGLASRPTLQHELARRCTAAQGTAARIVLVLLDVQDMAHVNQDFGTAAGDAVLTALGSRLVDAAPPGVDVARTGGDQLAALATLPVADGDEHAARLAAALRDALVEAVATAPDGAGVPTWPTVHAAVVCSAAGADDPDRLLLAAEARLRRAKSARRLQVPGPRTAGAPH
ncbi:GGDEF domain-containing protein [Cellulomonas soli]|uniref:GGDEF domain-containing protein n=1 Tax=Cellulomonas soli TaxID=931535 RepID=UPI003F82D118